MVIVTLDDYELDCTPLQIINDDRLGPLSVMLGNMLEEVGDVVDFEGLKFTRCVNKSGINYIFMLGDRDNYIGYEGKLPGIISELSFLSCNEI